MSEGAEQHRTKNKGCLSSIQATFAGMPKNASIQTVEDVCSNSARTLQTYISIFEHSFTYFNGLNMQRIYSMQLYCEGNYTYWIKTYHINRVREQYI